MEFRNAIEINGELFIAEVFAPYDPVLDRIADIFNLTEDHYAAAVS